MKFFKRLANALYAFSQDPDEDEKDFEEEEMQQLDKAIKLASFNLEKKITGILDDFVLKMPGLRAQAQSMAEVVVQKEKELIDGYFKDITASLYSRNAYAGLSGRQEADPRNDEQY